MPNDQFNFRFFTATGKQVPAVTADEMREVDRIATEETGPNLYQMMENAGRNLALLVIELLGENWQKARIVVLAGSGGNGGGGICAARHLANRNVDVRLCLAQPERLGEVSGWQRKIFQSTRGQEIDRSRLPEERPNLVLDALIGYGLKSAPDAGMAQLIRWANSSLSQVLALDVPSGLNATTGETSGTWTCIEPKWTMTLALPKTGLLPERAGELYLADIGIPAGTYRRLNLKYESPFESRVWVRLHCRKVLGLT
ncbi:MAG: NAD(P)H-hydrate epimerase [Acidobacteria bacterium]|nr:MAG: NAD(P)H-hydrate epimerase [Acidobacteriota bacterium]